MHLYTLITRIYVSSVSTLSDSSFVLSKGCEIISPKMLCGNIIMRGFDANITSLQCQLHVSGSSVLHHYISKEGVKLSLRLKL